MSDITVQRGSAPLIVSVPHAGTEIPADIESRLISPWRARKDADWWVDKLYGFASRLGATLVRTAVSRTAIDVNRDPTGKPLYPGQPTTELCPTTTFDGEPLYVGGYVPTAAETARRLDAYYKPYHEALASEIARLRKDHQTIVLFDAHSIRSRVPRLFDGELPHLNFGTNSGESCSAVLVQRLENVARDTQYSRVINGRFKGGYITRHYGAPDDGVHAVQLELAMRSYIDEPDALSPNNWPPQLSKTRVTSLQGLLTRLLESCIQFATTETV